MTTLCDSDALGHIEDVAPLDEVSCCRKPSGGASECLPELPSISVHANHASLMQLAAPGQHARRPLSKRRAWHEIKRFFDAESRHAEGGAWKAAYAKELILTAASEHMQRDGFVVIDAQLLPERFRKLAHKLSLEAPGERAALEAFFGGQHQAPQLCWVGAREQFLRDRRLLEEEEARFCDGRSLSGGPPLAPKGSDRRLPEEGEEDELAPVPAALDADSDPLSASCVLALACGAPDQMALRPKSRLQFLRFMKAFLDVVSENSMREPGAEDDKVRVRLCFGACPQPPSGASVADLT